MRKLIMLFSVPSLILGGAISPATVPAAKANPMEVSRPFPPGPPRWNENYKFLQDSEKRTDRFDNLRYHSLGKSSWLTLGGELRYTFTSIERPAFDMTAQSSDNYILQRAQAHGSLHLLDNRVRAFVQLENTRTWNQANPTPRDEAGNDVAQAFLDYNFKLGDINSTARLGRQEVVFGQGVLMNIGDLRNVRMAFDGARLTFSSQEGKKLELLALRPVSFDRDDFDDSSDNNVRLLGAYATLPWATGSGIDIYGFSREMKSRAFQGFQGKEERHTVGTRLFGKKDRLDWNWDLLYQTGEHGQRDIQAWGMRTDTGYNFEVPSKLRLGLRFDAASGGSISERNSRTFDPMYSRNGIYGETGVTTLANIIFAGPTLTISPTRTVNLHAEITPAWRQSTDDYVYLPNMRPLAATLGNDERDIGTIYQMRASWQPTRNFNLSLNMAHVSAGSAITEAGGKDVSAAVLRTILRF